MDYDVYITQFENAWKAIIRDTTLKIVTSKRTLFFFLYLVLFSEVWPQRTGFRSVLNGLLSLKELIIALIVG